VPPAGSLKRLQLRIAQIAPLYERVPPKLYGGTERVVSYLTEERAPQVLRLKKISRRGGWFLPFPVS
jgi:hypothetical protein